MAFHWPQQSSVIGNFSSGTAFDTSLLNEDTGMLAIDHITVSAGRRPSSTGSRQEFVVYAQSQNISAVPRYQGPLPKVPFSSQKVPTSEEWEYHRPTITKLYRDEKRSLKEVVTIMSMSYGHTANERMYKKRITDWDIRRNLRWSERENVCRVIKQKHMGRDPKAKITVKGQERKLALFMRHMKHAERQLRLCRSPSPDIPGDEARTVASSDDANACPVLQYTFAAQLSIPSTMHLPGDERLVEIICIQTTNLCEHGFAWAKPSTRLYDVLLLAAENVGYDHYRDARVLLNRAGKLLRKRITSHPPWVLMELIELLEVRSTWQPEHFNVFALFQKHALDMSTVVLGSQHPITVTLSLFSKLEQESCAVVPAFRCALKSLERHKDGRQSCDTGRRLKRRLAGALEKFQDFRQAGLLFRAVADSYQSDKSSDQDGYGHALFDLGYHYLLYGSSKYDDAENIFKQLLKLSDGSCWLQRHKHPFSAYLAYKGLFHLARPKGDREGQIYYGRLRLTAAASIWGTEHVSTVDAAQELASSLEDHGRHIEAQEVRSTVQLRDEFDDVDFS